MLKAYTNNIYYKLGLVLATIFTYEKKVRYMRAGPLILRVHIV